MELATVLGEETCGRMREVLGAWCCAQRIALEERRHRMVLHGARNRVFAGIGWREAETLQNVLQKESTTQRRPQPPSSPPGTTRFSRGHETPPPTPSPCDAMSGQSSFEYTQPRAGTQSSVLTRRLSELSAYEAQLLSLQQRLVKNHRSIVKKNEDSVRQVETEARGVGNRARRKKVLQMRAREDKWDEHFNSGADAGRRALKVTGKFRHPGTVLFTQDTTHSTQHKMQTQQGNDIHELVDKWGRVYCKDERDRRRERQKEQGGGGGGGHREEAIPLRRLLQR